MVQLIPGGGDVTILHYLAIGAALVAVAGMMTVSYIAILMVNDRKQNKGGE